MKIHPHPFQLSLCHLVRLIRNESTNKTFSLEYILVEPEKFWWKWFLSALAHKFPPSFENNPKIQIAIAAICYAVLLESVECGRKPKLSRFQPFSNNIQVLKC